MTHSTPHSNVVRNPEPRAVSSRPAAPNGSLAPALKRLHLLDHALARHALTALRSKHTRSQEFRDFSIQLLTLLTFEATRGLAVRNETVETLTQTCAGHVLAKRVVFLTVRREAHGLAHSILQLVPEILLGNISLGHSSGSHQLEPRLHLVNSPALRDVHVFLFDPVVASGLSACVALDYVRKCGALDVTLLSFLMSSPGLERVQAAMPDLTIWTAAVDREWDPKRGPIPGIGNMADRLYR